VSISTERGVLSENPIHAVIWAGNLDVNHVVLGNVQRWFPLPSADFFICKIIFYTKTCLVPMNRERKKQVGQ